MNKGSDMDNILHLRCCSDPVPHKVMSCANTPIISQESGPSEDITTVTTSSQVEVYKSSWEHQGRPTASPLQSW